MSKSVMLLPGGKHTTRNGAVWNPGDTFEVDEQEFNDWRERFQLVSRAEVVTPKAPKAPKGEADPKAEVEPKGE